MSNSTHWSIESATIGHILAAGISVDQACEGRGPTDQGHFADCSPRNVTGPTQQAGGVVIAAQLVPCRPCGSEIPSVYVTSVAADTAPGACEKVASAGDVRKLSRNADGASSFADIQFRMPHGN
jgi:hypothetical protein